MKRIMLVIAAVMMMCVTVSAQKNGKGKMESSGILVAYFSATGTTAGVARDIAEITGGKLYAIVPQIAYTSADLNWNDKQSRSSVEMSDSEVRPGIKSGKEEFSVYDVVFIGYPIWWNQAPRIINTFIESANWEGKILIPFATSGGSGIENSVKMLRKTYPKLNWKDGKLLNRADKEILQKWVDTFELKESFSQK